MLVAVSSKVLTAMEISYCCFLGWDVYIYESIIIYLSISFVKILLHSPTNMDGMLR
jgi:hypothetical protein